MKWVRGHCASVLLLALLLLNSCGNSFSEHPPVETMKTGAVSVMPKATPEWSLTPDNPTHGIDLVESPVPPEDPTVALDNWTYPLSEIPTYAGEPYVVICDNVPGFTEEDLTTVSFEAYSGLDYLGRCGPAWANVGRDLMPTEERGSIGLIRPSGWHTVKYDCVDGGYLYNRCHLLGYQLTGENANERNLITGTRYLNLEGMLPFENMVADYVVETDNHVLYRVTPVFKGEDLLARGVILEGLSVEDGGEGVTFCVYAHNVQPGVVIDYATGESRVDDAQEPEQTRGAEETADYILNINTKKFHIPTCSSVEQMSDKNKQYFTGSREAALAGGYEPCKRCQP